MENPIRCNLYAIGEILRTIGDNMCQQAKSEEKIDYPKMLWPMLGDFFKTVHTFTTELNTWREEVEKKREEDKKPKIYPKGYVESDVEFWTSMEQQEAENKEWFKNQHDIHHLQGVLWELIYENYLPEDSFPDRTFTFKEELWRLKWQLDKLGGLFPLPAY